MKLSDAFKWMLGAKCADHPDPKQFFPEHESGEGRAEKHARAVERAKAYCRGTRDGNECPVLNECMTHAIVFEEYGVWGGTSEAERDKIRGRRRSA